MSGLGGAWRLWTAGVTLMVVFTSACNYGADTPVPQYSYVPRVPTVTPTVRNKPSETHEPAANDLKKIPLTRRMDAGPLTVTVRYTTNLPVREWTSGVGKPLLIRLTAVNHRQKSQKIYLTRATVTMTAFDDLGPVGTPRAISDSTEIDPGFIVTSPNTYSQLFTLPAADDAAIKVKIDLVYEFAQQVGKDKDGRNFAKQVATDSVVVPLAGSG